MELVFPKRAQRFIDPGVFNGSDFGKTGNDD